MSKTTRVYFGVLHGEPARARYMMSFMTWVRLTVHWIVNDCDLGKVSVYTLSRDCMGLHMHVDGCVCVWNFEMKFF